MFDKILVPLDGSATSNCGLGQAIALAKLTRGRTRLIHVISDALSALNGEAVMVCSDEIHTAVTAVGSRTLAEAAALVEAERIPVDTVLCEPSGSRLSEQVEDASKSWGLT
jgi:nucleotide-binding universal stress UspA family protein